MRHHKAILTGANASEPWSRHVASLALPRRAISLPRDPEPNLEFQFFVELWGDEESLRECVTNWPFAARAWLVEEHVPLVYERSWPSGTPSPGVRMVSSLTRCENLTKEAFAAHWLGPHVEVALSYTVPFWHYNQNVVREALTPNSPEDGFVGMHFRTAERMRARWADHPTEAARGAADAKRFMAEAHAPPMVAIETVWSD